jgi:hypothetical protein
VEGCSSVVELLLRVCWVLSPALKKKKEILKSIKNPSQDFYEISKYHEDINLIYKVYQSVTEN